MGRYKSFSLAHYIAQVASPNFDWASASHRHKPFLCVFQLSTPEDRPPSNPNPAGLGISVFS